VIKLELTGGITLRVKNYLLTQTGHSQAYLQMVVMMMDAFHPRGFWLFLRHPPEPGSLGDRGSGSPE
jgi:hypothetical protein